MSNNRNPAYHQFENLTRKLLQVPKTELDRKVDEYNSRKRRKKRGRRGAT